MPGVVIIKGPLTGHKNNNMSPGGLFWPFLAFSANCGSRVVPFTGIWSCCWYYPGMSIFGPGTKIEGVLTTLSSCLLGGLHAAFRLFWEIKKEKMASIRT
jgi:hypothetical protein